MDVISSGIVAVSAGVSSTGLYVIQEGVLKVLNSGWAEDIGLAEGGQAVVSNGGILYICTVSSGGTATVLKGGYAQEITVENGGLYLVSSGGTMYQSLLLSGGTQIVYADVLADSITVMDGGVLHVSSGAYASNTVVSQGGTLHAWSSALVDGARVSGLVEANAKATVRNTSVLDGGRVAVLQDGYTNAVKISSGGTLDVSSGGTANNTSVYTNGYLYVSSGGTANSTTINSGTLIVWSGGTAINTTVNSGGQLGVYGGGTATDIVWTPCEGHVYVSGGGHATFVSQYSGVYYGSGNHLISNAEVMDFMTLGGTEEMNVMSGGTANSTTVDVRGKQHVSSGGTANETLVINDGNLTVSSGGIANSTTAVGGGRLFVCSDGTANSVTVCSYGKLEIKSGGTLTGRLYELGATTSISLESGAIINFDLTQTTPGCGARLRKYYGRADYVITVNSDQAEGTYTLAENANLFDKTISVQNVNGEELGTLLVGESIFISDIAYALNLTDGVLTLKVGENDTPSPYTSDGLFLQNGNADVQSNEVFHDTVLLSGGTLTVFSGGTANNTMLGEGGVIHVSGGIVNKTTFDFEGSMFISSGGIANDISFINRNTIEVLSGGIANSIAMLFGGSLHIASGGTATNILEIGYVDVEDGAEVSFISNTISKLLITSYTSAISVHSGTTLFNPEVSSGGSLAIFSGGTATDIVASEGAFLQFAVAPDTWIAGSSAGSAFEIKNGLVSDYVINSTNRITISSGGEAYNAIINSKGQLYVKLGGAAYNTIINPKGELYVEHGGEVNSTMVNGGNLRVLSNGIATDTLISGGSLHVSSAGLAKHTIVTEGSLFVSGGTANNTTINSKGFIYVSSGGTVNITMVDGAKLYVSYGGTANSTTVDYNGAMNVSGGTVNYTTVNSMGRMSISSGGTGNNTTVNDGGRLQVFSGGITNSTTVNSGGSMLVSSGVVANSTTVNSGGIMDVGGIANSTTVNGDELTRTTLKVSSGGTANNTTVNSAGRLFVTSQGMITGEMTFAESAVISAFEGAILDFDISELTPAAETRVNNLALIQGTPTYTLTVSDEQEKGVYILAEGAANFDSVITVQNTLGESIGTLTVDGSFETENRRYTLNLVDDVLSLTCHALIKDRIISNETVSVTDYVFFENPTVNSGGNLYISSGGTANNTTVTYGGGMYVSSGGTARDVVVHNGGSAKFGYATVDSVTVNAGATVSLERGTVTNIVENGGCVGYIDIYSGSFSFLPNTFSGLILDTDATVHSGTTATETTINAGYLMVFEGGVANSTTVNNISGGYYHGLDMFGGTANDTTVNSRGYMLIHSTAKANNTTVNAGGSMHVSSGGTANNTTINSGGRLQVRGGTVTGIVENGGYVYVEDGADVTFASNTISGLVLSGASATIHSGTTANSTTVCSGGILYIYSGGTAANVVWTPCEGHVYVLNGGYVTFASQYSGVYYGSDSQLLSNVSVVDSITLDGSCEMNVMSNGIANSTTVNGGYLYVSSGGTANGTTVNDGDLCVSSGGTANGTTVNGGYLYVSNGGTAICTTLNSNGILFVEEGGAANGITVNDGELCVSSGGTVNSTTVNSSGYLYLESGGKMTGQMMFEAGAVISTEEGGVLDFDLTQVEAGGTALVNDLSIIQGAPIYTLTVSDTQEKGVYTLAEGAAGFDGTITVQNTLGESLGTLAVDEKVTIGDADYTLNLNEGTLSVTVSAAPAPIKDASFFPGCFAGGTQAMLAKQTDNTVAIYFEQDTWGNGLALDPGWEIAGVGDFNGDGVDDFLRVNEEGYVVGEMSNGNGTFSPQVLNLKNAGWDILGTGDFNGNGTDDVLIANPTAASETVGLIGYWESGLTWTLINGYSPEWECIATGDFNGDGKCDMLWKNSFVGDGELTYNAYCTWIVDPPTGETDWRMVSVANPAEWNFLCSGDFDGDGANDIAMINGEGVVGIWGLNDGYFSSWSILSAVNTAEWTLAGVADFNGDGTDDIAWSNTDTGLTGYWQINDKQLTGWQTIVSLS